MANKINLSLDVLLKIEQDLQHSKKSQVIQEWAKTLEVSEKTLYRYFERRQKSQYPIKVPYDWLKKISSMKLMTLDKKGCCLSTEDAISELQRHRVLPQEFSFHRSTIDRLLRKYKLDIESLLQPSPAVHMVSYWPNQVHEVDATVAPTYYLNNFGRVAWDPFTQARHTTRRRSEYKLILYSGWDHFSSTLYAKYFLAKGENSTDLFHFLYEYWSRKKDTALPFFGFPLQYLYTDQGGIWKSKSISTLMERLGKIIGFQHKKHIPGVPRATGGAESSFNTLKRFEKQLRSRIKIGKKPTINELNGWLYEFLVDLNNDKKRGRNKIARNHLWVQNVDKSIIKTPPPLIDFLKMAYHKGETRQINKFTEISWHGKTYHLKNLEDMIGCEILVWHGLKEEAIYIEYMNQIFGPFYPGRNEVPFGQYKSYPLTRYEKTKRELKLLSGEMIGASEDYGFEDPTYIRQDNIQHPQSPGQKIEPTGEVADAQYPVQQYFTPDEAMLYIAMTVNFYWENAPVELKDFVSNHLEDIYLTQGKITRKYLDNTCAKLEPVLEEHGLITGENQ